MSDVFAREAWRLLEANYERVLAAPADLAARGAMLLGSHEAGIAIEQSMLGATHACANPLTAQYGTTHGIAIAVMLPHVVRWNATVVAERYRELLAIAGRAGERAPGEALAALLEALARAGESPGDAAPGSVCVATISPPWPPMRRRSGPAPSTRGRSTQRPRWRCTNEPARELLGYGLRASAYYRSRPESQKPSNRDR